MERKEQLRQLLANTTALLDAMQYSVESAGADDVWKYASYKTFLRKYVSLVQAAAPLLRNQAPLDTFNLEKIKGSGDTVALQQKELFEMGICLTVQRS
jgi:hypothetical protein